MALYLVVLLCIIHHRPEHYITKIPREFMSSFTLIIDGTLTGFLFLAVAIFVLLVTAVLLRGTWRNSYKSKRGDSWRDSGRSSSLWRCRPETEHSNNLWNYNFSATPAYLREKTKKTLTKPRFFIRIKYNICML